MRILITTDAFPPNSGGSGWSTYELARGLRSREHAVLVVRVSTAMRGSTAESTYDGFRVIDFRAFAPELPGVRNYFKNERLYRKLAKYLTRLISAEKIDVVHGQHVLSCVPSVEAAKRAGIASVCTVRDYWPVCYRSDLIHSPAGQALCPGCSYAAGTQSGRPRIGVTGLATSTVRTYLAANLRRKQEALANANAVIAVSSRIADDLRTRSAILKGVAIAVIPNPVNTSAVAAFVEKPSPLTEPYAVYVGKIAPNKGTRFLVDVVRRAELDWPLIVVGDGPDREQMEKDAAQSRRDIRFVGWLDQADTASWLTHASMLIFPSSGPESLSRVLIEASAAGVAIAAMNTGGTPDIVQDEITGLLSETPQELATDVRRLRGDAPLRGRLAHAAANHARKTFEASVVVERIEGVYRRALEGRRP
jgi:glycosyltransferase involved in cell wall biosynthesis